MTESKKDRRASEITACAVIVSNHFGADIHKVMSPKNYPGRATQDAKNVLYYHLHQQGISYCQIAKIWKRSIHNVQTNARHGFIRMMGPDRTMIESLPKITSTLTLSQAS